MSSTAKVHKRNTKGVLYIRTISPAVKSLFKSVCVRRGDEMGPVVEALMTLYVKDPAVVRVKKKRK